GWCSGAMIDPYHFLTAGHCVYQRGAGGWATNLDVDLAETTGGRRPFGEAHWARAWTYNSWINSSDPHWDFARIALDRNLGNFVGWQGTEAQPDSFYSGHPVLNTAGYPSDLGGGAYMYTENGAVDHADGYEVYYRMSTAPGQSGSAVWRAASDGPYVDVV